MNFQNVRVFAKCEVQPDKAGSDRLKPFLQQMLLLVAEVLPTEELTLGK